MPDALPSDSKLLKVASASSDAERGTLLYSTTTLFAAALQGQVDKAKVAELQGYLRELAANDCPKERVPLERGGTLLNERGFAASIFALLLAICFLIAHDIQKMKSRRDVASPEVASIPRPASRETSETSQKRSEPQSQALDAATEVANVVKNRAARTKPHSSERSFSSGDVITVEPMPDALAQKVPERPVDNERTASRGEDVETGQRPADKVDERVATADLPSSAMSEPNRRHEAIDALRTLRFR